MKLLLYCTKQPPYLFNQNVYEFYDSKYITSTHKFHEKQDYLLNGKIVAECDFEVEEIEKGYGTYHASFDEKGYFDDFYDYMTKTLDEDVLLKRSCLNVEEIEKYNPNYAIHVKNLHIFDSPVFLEGFDDNKGHTLRKAPKNMSKVLRVKIGDYDYQDLTSNAYEPNILISLKPQEMCRIANKEQTTLVRKNVLKELLK